MQTFSEEDKRLGTMFDSLLTTHCDSYHPDFSLSLVNSLKSYIDLKLGHQQKSPKLVNEVRRRLYLIHEYNCHVAQLTHKYPRTRKFDLLLIKYVELEFEVLYSNNPHPPKQVEALTELRVLRLLQVMLYQAVHNNQSLINENTDAILKKAVLRLLSEVKPACLVENKLVHNIANKLLKKIGGSSDEFHPQEIQRSLATSDYGTDDDSDFENDVFHKNMCHAQVDRFEKEPAIVSSTDCVEVPLTVNGAAPVPIVEFVDDDNYMVYLQSERKRKQKYSSKNPNSEFSNFSSKITGCNKTQLGVPEVAQSDNGSNNCVIICSDSEEEVDTAATNQLVSKDKNNKKHKNDKSVEKEKNKNIGVVTFEIIDDDEEDENALNYMVYLQKEVQTKNTQKSKPKEIIICSDSEDEAEVCIETNENIPLNSEDTKTQKSNNEEADVDDSSNQTQEIPQEDYSNKLIFDEETLEDVIDFIDTRSQNNPCLESFNNIEDTCQEKMKDIIQQQQNENNNIEVPPASSEENRENLNLFLMENEVGVNIVESPETNFLIDAAVIFDEITYTAMPPEELSPTKLLSSEIVTQTQSSSSFEELNFDKPNNLGGPVLSEKVDDCESFDNLQECRINDSLLEEFLLDDTYLLEGQKEFEELECFLFDDNRGEQKFYNSAFSIDSNSILQSENLESLLDDSQAFKPNSLLDFDKTSDYDLFDNGRKRKCVTKINQDNLKKCNKNFIYNKVAKEFVSSTSSSFGNSCNISTSLELNLKEKSRRFSYRNENRVNVR